MSKKTLEEAYAYVSKVSGDTSEEARHALRDAYIAGFEQGRKIETDEAPYIKLWKVIEQLSWYIMDAGSRGFVINSELVIANDWRDKAIKIIKSQTKKAKKKQIKTDVRHAAV